MLANGQKEQINSFQFTASKHISDLDMANELNRQDISTPNALSYDIQNQSAIPNQKLNSDIVDQNYFDQNNHDQ